jgi:hypothetical protein
LRAARDEDSFRVVGATFRAPSGQVGPGALAPTFCPQLGFPAAVAGCESLLGPAMDRALAPTGMPILVGLLGLLVMGIGWAIYRRSHPPAAKVDAAQQM